MSARGAKPRVALVLWDGELGGTELLFAGLAATMRQMGIEAELVFIAHPGPLEDRLAQSGVPFHSLGFGRGRDVLRHPRTFACAVGARGVDGAILPERGFIGAALRLGGFRARIVAGEHGVVLQSEPSLARRAVGGLNMLLGASAGDVELGVSEFMLSRMREAPHARRLELIYNGVDATRFSPAEDQPGAQDAGRARDELVVGLAARLIPGKGVDDAIAAVTTARGHTALELRIAGDGPERSRLQELARRDDGVEFLGLVRDMPNFWRGCDLALFPSHQFVESFGIAAVEAMACAKPVVATRNGALPEVVEDGVTGTVVAPGDRAAISDSLAMYYENPELRRAHGSAARARVLERFNLEVCARAYLGCLGIAATGGAELA